MSRLASLTIEDVIEMKDDLTFERLQKMPTDILEMIRRELMIELRALEKTNMYKDRQGAIRSSIDLCSMFMTVDKDTLTPYSVSTLSDLSIISETWRNTIKPHYSDAAKGSDGPFQSKSNSKKSRIPLLKSSFWSKPVLSMDNSDGANNPDHQVYTSNFRQKGTNGVIRLKK